MVEEEQFVSIDLNDDNICSICKLDTDTGTLSFCHVCFELSIEGVSTAALLHSTSLRGHRDCFEKYHLIANQKVSHATASHTTYKGIKRALSQQISRVVQYAINRDSGSKHQLLLHTQRDDRRLMPQSDTQVPRYAPCWLEGTCSGETEDLGQLWCNKPSRAVHQQGERGEQRESHYGGHSQEELIKMSVEELQQLYSQLLLQIEAVFEKLSVAVQEKDSLASQLHVRHIAIEQLFKNCAKLPWLQIGRAGIKTSNPSVE